MNHVHWDGGGFPRFTSYHDVRLPAYLIGPTVSDDRQFRYAFADLVVALRKNVNWPARFTPAQAAAIRHAMLSGGPRIAGFVWHHNADYGILQLVAAADHRSVHHFGGRFTTGGRP